MNKSEINILVEKYLDGETTIEEEKLLRALAGKGELPDQQGFLGDLFLFAQAEKNVQTDKKIDIPGDNILELEQTGLDKIGKRKTPASGNILRTKIFKYSASISGIAAAFLIAFLLLFNQSAPDPRDSYTEFLEHTDDPNEIIMGTLLFTSDNMQKAEEGLDKISSDNESMKKIEELRELFSN